jgi:hypothetical protein
LLGVQATSPREETNIEISNMANLDPIT